MAFATQPAKLPADFGYSVQESGKEVGNKVVSKTLKVKPKTVRPPSSKTKSPSKRPKAVKKPKLVKPKPTTKSRVEKRDRLLPWMA